MGKKIAIMTLAFNEADILPQCVKQFEGYGLDHYVFISSRPWNGNLINDKTKEVAESLDVTVFYRYWKNETDQRNWAVARLYDYDYILVVDADEMYTREGIELILHSLEERSEPLFRCFAVFTYWKTLEWILEPKDKHKPVIAIDPKKAEFYEYRIPRLLHDVSYAQYQPTINVDMHHLSWVKSDDKVKEKIASYSHCNNIRENWFEEVWLKWTPEMKNIRPYGVETSCAVNVKPPNLI